MKTSLLFIIALITSKMTTEDQLSIMTTLPIDERKHERNNDFFKSCGIITTHRNAHYMNAIFPQGWWAKKLYGTCFNYFDQNNYPIFQCERNSKYPYILIYDHETSIRRYNEYETLKNETMAVDNAIKTLFAQEWSSINKYIVYYYVSEKRRADSYMSGYRHDKSYDDCVVECSTHKFIGFVDKIDKYEIFVEIIKKNKLGTGYEFKHDSPLVIVIQETDEDFINLHRFEIKHMFGDDRGKYYKPRGNKLIIKETVICDQ